MCSMTTEDKILNASLLLFSQKGYTSVTTKEIAKEAGVCEMTLFRHFENKHNLFEKAFDQYVCFPKYRVLLEGLEWDMEKDLIKICTSYQYTLYNNRNIILMYLKNQQLNPDFDITIFRIPNDFIKLLTYYFDEMRKRHVILDNPDTLAISFLTTNFSLFVTSLVINKLTNNNDIEEYIQSYVKVFSKGITC